MELGSKTGEGLELAVRSGGIKGAVGWQEPQVLRRGSRVRGDLALRSAGVKGLAADGGGWRLEESRWAVEPEVVALVLCTLGSVTTTSSRGVTGGNLCLRKITSAAVCALKRKQEKD